MHYMEAYNYIWGTSNCCPEMLSNLQTNYKDDFESISKNAMKNYKPNQ